MVVQQNHENEISPLVTREGDKIWQLGDNLFVTLTSDPPPEKGVPSDWVYIKGSGEPIRHQDGRYAIRCTKNGRRLSPLDIENQDSLRG